MQSGGTRETKLRSACIFTLVAYGGCFRENLPNSHFQIKTQFLTILGGK